jgi:hypothetical protein
MKIKGHTGFVRDIHSGAVINNDRDEYLKYKKHREALRKKDKNIEILTNKVEKLENIVNELARKIEN